jgi:8-oxo-dGTP diphosphatase
MPYLVRHAHAGNKHHWSGPDQDRPLSVTGQCEAVGLLARLSDYLVTRVLSSPAVRCRQSVAPLAKRGGLPVELTDALAVDASVDELRALIGDPSMQTVVLCTHGELIGQLIRDLAAGGLVFADPLCWDKGSTWVLEGAGGALTAARYLPPLWLPGHVLHTTASRPHGPVTGVRPSDAVETATRSATESVGGAGLTAASRDSQANLSVRGRPDS